jgi:hypothetical protein
VARVAVHAVVAIGGTAVAEEDHDLVDGFGVLTEVILNSIGRQSANLVFADEMRTQNISASLR